MNNVVSTYNAEYKALQQVIKDNYELFEVDYYAVDNDNYVDGEGFCCEPQAQSRNLRSIPTQNVDYEKLQYYYHSDHLGSANYITNLDGEVVQHVEYIPFGEVFIEERNNTWNTPYLFNGKELDEETGLYYYGARYYNPRISLWYGVDPLAEKYPAHSPYCYTMNNPVMLVDPDGMAANPIYDNEGEFLGTDDKGLQGEAIVMDREDFTQGMSHDDALSKGTLFSDLGNLDRWNFMDKGWEHWKTLDQRPDWDGFVTIQEGIDWAKAHLGALDNPTPDNILYLDASKLDFGNISVSDFRNGAFKASPINLLNKGNLKASATNETLRATVYALGRVNMFLHGTGSGTVSIVNDFNLSSGRATDYDWNTGGTLLRRTLINAERGRTGINDTHGFRTYYYGKGRLNINQ